MRSSAVCLRPAEHYNVHLTRYSAIAVPTLLLIGGASPPRQQPGCEELAAALADVRVERLDGFGHVGARHPSRTSSRA